MKKAFLSIFMSIAILLSFSSVSAMAANENIDSPDTPSELFIDLYSEVFLQTETYEVYNSGGVCITDTFVSEFYDDFLNSNFLPMWNAVAENRYVLKYGEPQYVREETQQRASRAMITVYSEWTYRLEELDELLPGKMVEFLYRVAGQYSTNGTIVNGFTYPPKLELNMTFPGSLFTYTTSPSFSVDYNATHTQIYFDMSLSITFCYPYSDALNQTIGPYTARAVGNA